MIDEEVRKQARNTLFKLQMKTEGKIVRSNKENYYSGSYAFYCPEHDEANNEGFVYYNGEQDYCKPMSDYLRFDTLCIDTRANFAKLKNKELKVGSLDYALNILSLGTLKVGCQYVKFNDVIKIRNFLNEHYK